MICPAPDPAAWHRAPNTSGPCAVCTCPRDKCRTTQHRQASGGWEKRRRSRSGWVVQLIPYQPPRIDRVGRPSLSEDLRDKIRRAAILSAAGLQTTPIARTLGVHPTTVRKWRRRQPEFWQQSLDQAGPIVAALPRPTTPDEAPPPAETRNHATVHRRVQRRDQAAAGPMVATDAESRGPTLWAFFHDTYKPMRLITAAPGTIVQYETAIRVLGHWFGRGVAIAELSDELLSAHLNHLVQTGRAIATVNKQRAHIQALWNYARRRKLIDVGPDVQKLREPKRIPVAWSLLEFEAILAAAAATAGEVKGIAAAAFWPAFLLCLYDTGLRLSALLAVTWDELDIEAGSIQILAENQKQKCEQRFELHPQTIEAVAAIREPARDCVFPLGVAWARRYYKRILGRAGLSSGRRDLFHKVRRTSATYVANELGRPAAQAHLGHSTMAVTEAYLDTSKIQRIQVARAIPRPKLNGTEQQPAKELNP